MLSGFWLGIVLIASAMSYDLKARYGNFWSSFDNFTISNPKGYWDSVSARVQPALIQLGMTEIPNDFSWAGDQAGSEHLTYPQRWHSTLLYLVVGLLYYMITTTTPNIENTQGMEDPLWDSFTEFLNKNLSKTSRAKIGWIASYYAAYSIEIWLLGVYAFDEW